LDAGKLTGRERQKGRRAEGQKGRRAEGQKGRRAEETLNFSSNPNLVFVVENHMRG
jgi:hypothetical protein